MLFKATGASSKRSYSFLDVDDTVHVFLSIPANISHKDLLYEAADEFLTKELDSFLDVDDAVHFPCVNQKDLRSKWVGAFLKKGAIPSWTYKIKYTQLLL